MHSVVISLAVSSAFVACVHFALAGLLWHRSRMPHHGALKSLSVFLLCCGLSNIAATFMPFHRSLMALAVFRSLSALAGLIAVHHLSRMTFQPHPREAYLATTRMLQEAARDCFS